MFILPLFDITPDQTITAAMLFVMGVAFLTIAKTKKIDLSLQEDTSPLVVWAVSFFHGMVITGAIALVIPV